MVSSGNDAERGWIKWDALDFSGLSEIMESRCGCAVEVRIHGRGFEVTLEGDNCEAYLRSEWDRIHVTRSGLPSRGAAQVAFAPPEQGTFLAKSNFVYGGLLVPANPSLYSGDT